MIAQFAAAVATASAPLTFEERFVQSCFDGSTSLPKAAVSEIAFTDLPKPLQRHRLGLVNAAVFRLEAVKIGYLIVGTSNTAPELKHCAISARNLSVKRVRDEFTKRGFPAALTLFPDKPLGSYSSSIRYERSGGHTANLIIGWDRLPGGWFYAEIVTENMAPEQLARRQERKTK